MRWIALCLALLLATSCGGDEDVSPPVDWQQVSLAQRNVINRVVDDGDCDGMQAAFDGSSATDVLAYLDWHMKDVGCY